MTNIHMHLDIGKSNLINSDLSEKYDVSENTISKWKNRDNFKDKSSKKNFESFITAANSIKNH
jgi:uncharacterized protein YjcR